MRISDWSSDVCSSDLPALHAPGFGIADHARPQHHRQPTGGAKFEVDLALPVVGQREHVPGQQRPVVRIGAKETVFDAVPYLRSDKHTSELQSLMRISYAVFYLKTKNNTHNLTHNKINKQEP